MASSAFLQAHGVLRRLGPTRGLLLAAQMVLPSFAQADVTPFHCIDPRDPSDPGDGRVTAWIGYRNDSDEAITVPFGPDNFFSPIPAFRGQIEDLPGVHLRAFSFVLDLDDPSVAYEVNGTRTEITTDIEDYCASPVNAVVVTPSGVLFAGTENSGIYRSTDDAATWEAANTGLADLDITALAMAPDDGAVYAGTRTGGVFKSVDGGYDWLPVGLNGLRIHTLRIHPTDSSLVFAGTDNGVHKSTDRGDTWQAMNNGLPGGTP